MKKKVLFITSLFPSIKDPSFGSFVYDQIKIMETKCEVRIIVERKNEFNKRKFIKTLLSKFSDLFIKRIDNEFVTEFTTYGIEYPYFSFYLPPKLQFVFIVNVFNKLINNLIKDDQWIPDIIHAHYILNSGIFAHEISKSLNIPFVISEHNSLNFSQNTFWIKKAKEAYFNCNTFCVVSHHEYRRMLTFDCEKEPVILNNYVDEELFRIQKNEMEKFTVLFIGYPHPLKGMKHLFKIISYIKDKNIENIIFNIVSPDYKTNEFPNGIIDFIKENKLSSYCKVLPRVENNKMPSFYKNCNLFISTSINETFGLSILEALMCGVPVVTTKCGGPDDFLTVNNSLSFRINDYKSMAEAIIKIKNREIVFNALDVRKSVINKFGKDNYIDNLSCIYENLTN